MKYALALIFGLAFLGATAVWFGTYRRLTRTGVRTTAQVVQLRERAESSKDTPIAQVGGVVQVVYDPATRKQYEPTATSAVAQRSCRSLAPSGSG